MNDSQSKPLISRYRLKARSFLNSISNRRVFEGALIEVDGGYGCIHPWPELGDPPLEKCLQDLQGARRWPIVKRALRCAEYDRAARENEDSLFEELEVPMSHATLPAVDLEQIGAAVAAGFEVVKLKFGRDPLRESELLNEASTAFPQLKWRPDFNEAYDPAQVRVFLKGLSSEARRAIDFLEDPCPYAEGTWGALFKEFRVPMAVDRESSPQAEAAQVMVVKPAIDEPWLLTEAALNHQQRVVVTSYMEHPVGQAFAAWEAGRLGLQFEIPGLIGVCGLQTHHLFEADAFTEMLGDWSPTFQSPTGLGIGFDDLLGELPWTRLY